MFTSEYILTNLKSQLTFQRQVIIKIAFRAELVLEITGLALLNIHFKNRDIKIVKDYKNN
jgi:glycyl-tRNA synthetase alpha subunit